MKFLSIKETSIKYSIRQDILKMNKTQLKLVIESINKRIEQLNEDE